MAQSGNPNGADGELKALRQARDGLETPRRGRRGGGALEFAAIADAVARGRIATARGDVAGALRAYAAAEAIEANLPYAEPPLWPLPISVLSGQLRAAQETAPVQPPISAAPWPSARVCASPAIGWPLPTALDPAQAQPFLHSSNRNR